MILIHQHVLDALMVMRVGSKSHERPLCYAASGSVVCDNGSTNSQVSTSIQQESGTLACWQAWICVLLKA
jgi:hypothetical protein